MMDCLLYYREAYEGKIKQLENRVKEMATRSNRREGLTIEIPSSRDLTQHYASEARAIAGSYATCTPLYRRRALKLRSAQGNLTAAANTLSSMIKEKQLLKSKKLSSGKFSRVPSTMPSAKKKPENFNHFKQEEEYLATNREGNEDAKNESLEERKYEVVIEENKAISMREDELDLGSLFDPSESILSLYPTYDSENTKVCARRFMNKYDLILDKNKIVSDKVPESIIRNAKHIARKAMQSTPSQTL
eukprot:TRINITY_DN3075_c0_g1_i5.p1 TRINITY_DN3075_c0_g1~~TRINITY_DN3075_c0_g1_i5.p1  ORF type:complete len:247 (-),score=41.45 TRINITY_DN3075_c0_g1_i5:69-809(-)